MSNRAVQITISILLVVSVLCCSFSVMADDEDDPLTGGNPYLDSDFDQVAFLIWQLLESWGINVSYQEVTGYTTPVQDQVKQWIYEYLATQPSVETVTAWVVDWVFDTDYWGNLVVNNTLLDDVRQFANWLQSKYPLSNNTSVVVDPENQLNNLKVYRLPAYYTTYYDYVAQEWRWEQITIDDNVYVVFYTDELNGRDYIYMRPFKKNNYSVEFARYRGNQLNYSDRYQFNRPKIGVWYWDSMGLDYVYSQEFGNGIATLPYRVYTKESVEYAMANSNTVEQVGDLYILTTEVIVPELNVDYTNQDGMIIIDGSPSYEIVEFPDSITVDNLPAIVSTRDIDNPHMEEAYQPVQGLIEMTKDGVELMHGIVNELPAEAVTCIYALIGAVIIFGMIKLMREH